MNQLPTPNGFTVFGTDKDAFDKYCIALMQEGYTMLNHRSVTQWPMFFVTMHYAEFCPPQVKPYTFSHPFTFEDGVPPQKTIKERIDEAVSQENYEEAARLQAILNEKAA